MGELSGALLLERLPYIAAWMLLVLGLTVMARTRNLAKQLVGLYFVQTAIIVFFMALSAKAGALAPILTHDLAHNVSGAAAEINAAHYANPLPHVLMLTAIVVGVATQGVAFVLMRRIFRACHTLEQDELPLT